MDKFTPSRAELARLVVNLNKVPTSKVEWQKEHHLKMAALTQSAGFGWLIFCLVSSIGLLQEYFVLLACLVAGPAGMALMYRKSRKHQAYASLYRPLTAAEIEALASASWRSDVAREHLQRARARHRELYWADLQYVRQILVRENRNGAQDSDRLPLEQTRDVLAHLATR